MRSRVSASGACLRTSSSKVALASSIIAQSSPRISMPARSNRFGSTNLGSFPSSSRPRESASRLAGSMVRTATFWPRAASPAASAAGGGVVVGDEPVELLGLGVDGSHAGDAREGPGRLQEADSVARGGGVDDHQVVLAALLDPAVRLGELPDLPDRDQLLESGSGRRQV